jgi:hypothetical protein
MYVKGLARNPTTAYRAVEGKFFRTEAEIWLAQAKAD